MNMNMNFSSIYASILTVTLFTMSTPTMAGTPDGLTPNSEVICDGLKGATLGLYGLCIAYCEATDSPEDLSSEAKIAALPTHSAKLLANYDKMRQIGDPQMPCATYYDETACPAWTRDQINSVGTHVTSASEGDYQYRDDDTVNDSGTYKILFDREYVYNRTNRYVHNYVHIYSSNGYNYGQFYDYEWDYTTSTDVRYDYNRVTLTDEEYAACDAEIRAHIMPIQSP